jgi:hypothetical protein
MALHLLETRYGASRTAEIERILEYSAAREANRRRFRGKVGVVSTLMESGLHENH